MASSCGGKLRRLFSLLENADQIALVLGHHVLPVNRSAASKITKAPGMTRANANWKNGVKCIMRRETAPRSAATRRWCGRAARDRPHWDAAVGARPIEIFGQPVAFEQPAIAAPIEFGAGSLGERASRSGPIMVMAASLILPQQLLQLGDVHRDPACFVAGE